jgi:uncharacterized membrane protein
MRNCCKGFLLFLIWGLLVTGTVQADSGSDVFSFVNSQETEVMQTAESSSDLGLFFGRFHPVLVHLPIGFLLMAFLLEFASLMKRYEQLSQAVPFVLLMGLLSGVFTAITGFMLSDAGGYGEDTLWLHKWMGISVIVLSLAAYILRIKWYDDPFWKRIFRITMVVMVAVLMGAGHYGGSLTHGSDYLFRYMPEPIRSWIGVENPEPEQVALIEDLDTALVYRDVIEPIFRARCQSCHDPDRTEGELLMTSYEQLMAGGESGPAVVAHQAEESELYRRLLLPDRHDDRMPPRGRTQLTPQQVRLIGWWIEQGAHSDRLVMELDTEDDIQQILESLTVAGQSFFDRTEVAYADEQLIEAARTQGFRVSPVSEDLAFLQVSVSASKTDISESDMELLLQLSDQITWLNLSRTSVTDDDLEELSQFKNLTRLYLQLTEISDSTLSRIGSLENLEYLNVYATNVGDEGLQYLEPLTQLKTLYLWQTGVSNEGALALKNNRPGIYINMGAEFDEMSGQNQN